jgi:hypothetical protein
VRWVKIGERVHAVAHRSRDALPIDRHTTLCGLELERAKSIAVAPGFDNRCGNCDKRWREIGRATKPPVKKVDARTVYRPQYTFADFEREAT